MGCIQGLLNGSINIVKYALVRIYCKIKYYIFNSNLVKNII